MVVVVDVLVVDVLVEDVLVEVDVLVVASFSHWPGG